MAQWQQREQRYLLALPLRCRKTGANIWSPGQAHNVSSSGVLFTTECELLLGSEIDVELLLETDDKQLPSKVNGRARVVRIQQNTRATAPAVGAMFLEHKLLPRELRSTGHG